MFNRKILLITGGTGSFGNAVLFRIDKNVGFMLALGELGRN